MKFIKPTTAMNNDLFSIWGSIIKRNLLVFLSLLLVFCFSCRKNESAIKTIGDQLSMQETTQLLMDSFALRHYDKKLTGNFGENQLYWAPQWTAVSKSVRSKKQTFYYIPLEPRLVGKDGKILAQKVHQMRSRSYLLVSVTADGVEYTRATYISDSSGKNEMMDMASNKVFFKNFTGHLHANSLDKNKAYGYDYKNALVVPAQKRVKTIMSTKEGIKQGNVLADGHFEQVCSTVVVCDYGATCYNGEVWVTSVIGCGTPLDMPCYGNSSGGWYYVGSHEDPAGCEQVWVEDPPPPDDNNDPCALYGIGCPEDGTSDGASNNIIIDSIKNPCLQNVINNALINNYKSKLSKLLNDIFGKSLKFDIIFGEKSDLDDFTNGYTEATVSTNTTTGDTIKITFNIFLNVKTLPNASKEYTTRVMFHEFLHAYLNYTGLWGTVQTHNEMADKYRNEIADALKINYPELSDEDAQAMAWAGLQDTNAWTKFKNDYPDEALSAKVIDSQYRTGVSKGTKCSN